MTIHIALLRGINVGGRRPFNFAKDQTGLIMFPFLIQEREQRRLAR
jgi:hypothetical protein